MCLLITIEGIDGSGKTTLIKNLQKNTELSLIVHNWRDTDLGQKMWNLINESRGEGKNDLPSTWSYIFLILTAFDELNQKVIKPNLQENKVIVIDRYLDSTFVYQGLESNLGVSPIQTIAKKTIKLPFPDLTFVLDIEPLKAQTRLTKRKEETGEYTNWDNLKLDFHQRIRNYYLELKAYFPERIVIINAEQSQEEILEEVISVIKKKIQTKQNNSELTNLIDCCELVKKTINLFQEDHSAYENTESRRNVFVYWSYAGLNEKMCSQCRQKWNWEYDRLRKEESEKIKEKLRLEKEKKERKYQEEAEKRININCLYNHFKDTPKKLQIVCDWDEVIQPLEPKVYYELSEREGAYYDAPWWKPNGTKFEEFFRDFWPNAPIYFSDYGSHSIYNEESMLKSCLTENDSFALGPRSIKNKIDKIKNEPNFYEHSPFLTIAKELLMLVKENKISVTFLSAYDKRVFTDGDPRKKQIFAETFGKFPNCSLKLVGFESEGQGRSKSEWVKENAPNCDVVIDDNPNILANVLKDNDKITVIAPFYSSIKHHEKVLLVKTSLSNLKKIDFKY